MAVNFLSRPFLIVKPFNNILAIAATLALLGMLVMLVIHFLPISPGISMSTVAASLLMLAGTPLLYFGFMRRYQLETGRLAQVETTLSEEHGLLSTIINTTSSFMMVIDRTGRIVRCNQACEKALGYAPGELAGKEAQRLFRDPADAQSIPAMAESLRSAGSLEERDQSLKTLNGEVRTIRWTYALLEQNPEGDDLILMTGIDVTGQKLADDKRAETAGQWELTFNSMVDGVSIHSTDFEIVNVNSVLCEMLGMTREELIGKKCHEVFHHKSNPIEECPLLKTRGSGKREYVELFEESIGGGTWLSVATAPMRNDSGEIINIIHVVRNISEQKKAEAALRGALHHNELILNNAGEGIFGVDTEGLITFINPAAASMLGCIPAKVTGKSFHILWHHTSEDGTPLPEIECAIMTTARTGLSCVVKDAVFHRTDGSRFPVEYVGKGIIDQGKCRGAVVIFRDVSKTRETEQQIQHQLENLAALHEIDLAITASIDLNITLKVILAQIIEQLDVDAADILLLDTRLNTLEFAASRGFRSDPERSGVLHVNESVAGQAVLGRRLVGIANLKKTEERFVRSPLFSKEDFTTYHAVPLITKGQIKGVLEVFHRRRFFPNDDWKGFLKTIAAQAAIAIDNAGLFDDLQRTNSELVMAYDTTLEGWSRAMDLRDKETEGHTRRVSELTVFLARAMRVPDAELVHMYRGALLHDVGKLGIPDNILLKPGRLNDEEWNIMKRHPQYAYELLSPISYLRPAIDIPYCHHEKWDGSGYPRGLKGEQIPSAARIFSLVDVWDALCSDRPYRPAWTEDKAREHIISLSGTHLDPQVVKAFVSLYPGKTY